MSLDTVMEDQDDTLASLDLYDDLITDEGLSRQENYDELSKKYDAAVLKIIELESKVDTLQKSESQLSEKCGILEKNISTLFLTARLELQRKDRVIQQYKHMREPRKQTNTASASNLRLDRDDRRFNSERSKQHGDSILVDKVKTKRRLSSDDREEKIKKKRKLSEKTCGEENASKSLNTTTRTDNCGQNAARKILEKSRKDIQRRLSGGKPSSHEYEHDKNKEREKKKKSTESKSSANECSKSERHDRREKKRQNNVGNEKRGETKTKDSGIKTTSGNVHSVEENRNKTTASRGVLDLRDKLKMKRFKDEKSFKKDNVLENKRNPCSISKVDSISDSPKEKMKSVGDILSPKHKNRSSSSNRNRQGNRSSEEKYPQIGLVAKSCNTKESDHELKKKVSSISKPRSDCDKQVNQNRKSSADAKSSLDSERLKSRSKCSQGVVASDEHCTDNNLHSESSSLVRHVKKTSSLESTLPDQVTNNLEKCSSPQVNEVLVSGSKENTSSFSHLERANETCSESKKSKKESADSPDPTSVERTSSQLPLQETEEENISDKTILNDEANQIKGKLKNAPTTGQVRKNDQDEQQKSHLFSVGNGKSEDMSAVHFSEPVLSSPVVDRNYRKSRESSLSAASVMEECQTSETCLQSVTQEICLKNLKSVGSRETIHPMESCTGARYHSKEKLVEKEKHALEIASYNVSQTKLGYVKKEPGNRKTVTTYEKNQVNVDIEHASQRRERKLENSPNMDIDELKGTIKTETEINKLHSVPDQQTSCNFNVCDDDERDKLNCNSTEDIRMATKNVRSPLSRKIVKQTSVRSKDSVNVKRERVSSSPAGKIRERKEPKTVDVSATKMELITSPRGRKSRERKEPNSMDVSVTPSKHRHFSQINQSDWKIPKKSKSQINVSPGSKENASMSVSFVNENRSPAQLSKSERMVHKLNTDEGKFSTVEKDLTDIPTKRISLEEVGQCDNLELEKSKGRPDSESKKDSVDISTSKDNQNEVVPEQLISETERESTARLPEMSTGKYSTPEMALESCENETSDTTSHGKEKINTESSSMEKVVTKISGVEDLDTGSCGTEELNTKTLEKEKLDNNICENEKVDSGSSKIGKPDTELYDEENLNTELCRMERIDTDICNTEKVDLKSDGMEELDTELSGMENFDTGLCRLGKSDTETYETEKQSTKSGIRGEVNDELFEKDTGPCKKEKLDTESQSMEEQDPESVETEKLDTKPQGKEKLDSASLGTNKLDTLNIEMDEKEPSPEIHCKTPIHNEEKSEDCLTKTSKQQLDLNDSGKGRPHSTNNLLNKAEDDNSAGNRKRSASSAQSDSTLESDLEMSSDSDSEESGAEDQVKDSKSFYPSDIKTDTSHDDKLSHNLNNSVVSHTSESGSDVCCSTDRSEVEDLNDHGYGQCSSKLDGSHTPKQISSKMLKRSEKLTGSQKSDQNYLQTPDKNQDLYEEDLDYEYESDSSLLSSDQQGCDKSPGNNNELLINDNESTEEFSDLDTGAEDSQGDELMLCVSPSESMEFDTELNVEECKNENTKIKKPITPKKKIPCRKSKKEDAKMSSSKQRDSGSHVSRRSSNDRKDHKQRERNPSYECSKSLHSRENIGDRSNKKDSIDNQRQRKSESYGTNSGSETSKRSCHKYSDEKRLKERERNDKMSAQKKHREHTERRGKNLESPRISKDNERKRSSKEHYNDRDKTSKDRHSDTERTYKDRHSDTERAYKDRHSDTERAYKDRHSDTERTYKDRHSDTERTYKDRHSDTERIYKDCHSDTERTYKDRHSDTERIYKDRHSDTERTYKDRHSDTERTSKDRHSDTERTYKDRHSDTEKASKDWHGETKRIFKDRHDDNYRERMSRDCQYHEERTNTDKEKKFKEQGSVHQRSSIDHLSARKRTLKSNQDDQEGKAMENQTEGEGVSEVNQKHHNSHRESSKKTLSSKCRETSEKKAMRKTARNLERKYESPKILRTVTSETIFCAEGSHEMTDTMELYDESKSAGIENPSLSGICTDNPSIQGKGHITISHNSLQGAENITISHTDQDGERRSDSKDKDRLHPLLANKWSAGVCETSQHDIVNITRIDSDEEDMEIRVTDSSNSCSDDFLSDVSEPDKCARVRTWQEVAKIFRENVDILDKEEVEESVVHESSDNEDSSSDSDSDTTGDENESDDSCYAIESNYTFELCKNPDTLSDGEDVKSYSPVEPRKDVGSYTSIEPETQSDRENVIKSPDSCRLNPPEIYNDNASDNFKDSLDDRFHNCPTNIPKNCIINEESLEDGEILTDSEEKVETIPHGIKSRKKLSHVEVMVSHGKNVNKCDKHGSPRNVSKSKYHGNRGDKRSSERPLISPRPSPRKGRSPRDEMYRRKHLQTAVKVLQNRSRERKSHTGPGMSPVKVPRQCGSVNIDGTDLRNRIGDKPSRILEDRLPIRKRKRSRSCERGSRIKKVSPRRS